MKDNKFIMAVISFILPGSGHLILGEKKKGWILLILGLVLNGLTVTEVPLMFFPMFIVMIYAVVSCINTISKRRQQYNTE